jgi:WD40 repeat protein
VGTLERLGRWCRRNPALAGLTATVATLLLAAAVLSTAAALRIDAHRRAAERSAEEARQAGAAADANAARADQARQDAVAALDREKDALTKALTAEAIAGEQKQQAEAERQRAEAAGMILYFNGIAAAERYWSSNNVELADQKLDDCPSHLRHWEWHYLKRLCHAELGTVAGPSARAVRAVALDPDARYVASLQGTVWDAETGRKQIDLEELETARCIAFGPGGLVLATGGDDHTAHVWDARTGKSLAVLAGHTGACNGVAFGPGGKLLATASEDKTARIWDVKTGKQVLVLRGHALPVNGVAFRPDGQRLATAGGDEAVKIWDLDPDPKVGPLPASKELRTLSGHKGQVLSVVFSADGRRLASASRDSTGKVWDAENGKELFTLSGHAGLVNGVAFSPDGKRLATAGDDKTVRVWDGQTGRELFTLRGHATPVLTVAYRPDGRQLVSVGDDHTLKVWDAATGRQGLRWPGTVHGLAFSPDGQSLVTASAQEVGAVTAHDVRTGREVFTLRGPRGEVQRHAFSPDGRRLTCVTRRLDPAGTPVLELTMWDVPARKVIFGPSQFPPGVSCLAFSPDGPRVAVGHDKSIILRDATGGKESRTLVNELSGSVECLAFSADGRRLAAAGGSPLNAVGFRDYTIQIREVATGRLLHVGAGHQGPVHDMAFSPAGPGAADDLLATAGDDQTVQVWELGPPRTGKDLPEGRWAGRRLFTLRGHTQAVRSVAFSRDRKRLVSVSWDGSRRLGEVKFWDVGTGQEILTLAQPGGAVAFSPDGRFLAVASADGTMVVWDGTPTRELRTYRDAGPSVALSPDGQLLATAGQGETIKVWDLKTGHFRTLRGKADGYADGHTQSVHRVGFSPDGRLLASASEDHTVKLWDVAAARVVRTLAGHTDGVVSLAFSPDGSRIASTSADQTTKVWNASTGQVVSTFGGHTDRVLCVAFSPDGQRLVSGGDDKTVRIWEAGTGHELLCLDRHTGDVNGVAFSPDGRLFASAGEDQVVRIWDAATGKEVRTLPAQPDSVRDVAFSPEGKRLATAGWDGTVRIWDVSSGQELLLLRGHTGGVATLSFTADGRLASGGADRTARLWNTKP